MTSYQRLKAENERVKKELSESYQYGFKLLDDSHFYLQEKISRKLRIKLSKEVDRAIWMGDGLKSDYVGMITNIDGI